MSLLLSEPLAPTTVCDEQGRALSDLRISVTDRCNFRCPHCMPAKITKDESSCLGDDKYLSVDEIVRITRCATTLGISKVRLTGGEPLLRTDLTDLIEKLSNLETLKDIALTTNGLLLEKHLFALKAAGLKRLTISLNTLDNAVFSRMSGHSDDSIQTVLKAIDSAHAAGFSPIKINVVVQKRINEDAILPLTEHFRGTPHILRFIEYMDVGTKNNWSLDDVVYAKDIFSIINSKYPLLPLEKKFSSDTAKRFCYKDGQGEIGIIAAISDPFCNTCNRLRLTSDGKLYTCLFAPQGIDLKEILSQGANDTQITDMIKTIWQERKSAYSQNRCHYLAKNIKSKKIEMYKIGG